MTNGPRRVALIATGGTIDSVGVDRLDLAWYIEADKRLGPGELLAQIPELAKIAQIQEVPFRRLKSHGLVVKDWLDLVRLIHDTLEGGRADGLVITHGTNTLEETAYFLNLVVKTDRPVVLVGSMRPASGLSADGPLNLLNAVRVAAGPASRGRRGDRERGHRRGPPDAARGRGPHPGPRGRRGRVPELPGWVRTGRAGACSGAPRIRRRGQSGSLEGTGPSFPGDHAHKGPSQDPGDVRRVLGGDHRAAHRRRCTARARLGLPHGRARGGEVRAGGRDRDAGRRRPIQRRSPREDRSDQCPPRWHDDARGTRPRRLASAHGRAGLGPTHRRRG